MRTALVTTPTMRTPLTSDAEPSGVTADSEAASQRLEADDDEHREEDESNPPVRQPRQKPGAERAPARTPSATGPAIGGSTSPRPR